MFKFARRILLLFLLLIFFAFAAVYFFVELKARDAAVVKLQETFGRPVTIEDVHYRFPFGLYVSRLAIGTDFQVKSVMISLRPECLWQRQLWVQRVWIKDPEIIVSRLPDGKIALGDNFTKSPSALESISELVNKLVKNVLPVDFKETKGVALNLLVDDLRVEGGHMAFTDQSFAQEVKVTLEKIDFHVNDLAYPVRALRSNIRFQAFVEECSLTALPLTNSKIQSEGWVDPVGLNMEESFNVSNERGLKILTANIVSHQNDLMVEGEINLADLFALTSLQKQEPTLNLVKGFSALKDVTMKSKFAFKTQMDHFKIENVSFQGNISLPSELFPSK